MSKPNTEHPAEMEQTCHTGTYILPKIYYTVYIYIYVYICVYMCVYIYVCVYMYIIIWSCSAARGLSVRRVLYIKPEEQDVPTNAHAHPENSNW